LLAALDRGHFDAPSTRRTHPDIPFSLILSVTGLLGDRASTTGVRVALVAATSTRVLIPAGLLAGPDPTLVLRINEWRLTPAS
jgi:hypothetical protein